MILKGLLLMGYPVIADLRKRQFYVWPVIAVGIVLAVIQLFSKETTIVRVLTGCIPGIIVWIISRMSHGAIGEGDAFVIGGLGLLIGWRGVCSICLIACMMSACVGVYLILERKAEKWTSLPFVPFLMAAYILRCLWIL